MIHNISILIPAYNYVCVALVEGLQRQASNASVSYEVIVADDGSTDLAIVEANQRINQLSHCTYIRREQNVGRSEIRNFLVSQSQYDRLLFLDCDMELPDNLFLQRYLQHDDEAVIDGGIRIGGDPHVLRHNIRYLYEHASEPQHTATARQQHPYKSFRTTNFMAPRTVMTAHPFDRRFLHYGYEDVLFGKELQRAAIPILHIDNPMVLTDYESNPIFISKTEEGLRTLHEFRSDLRDYSTLLRRYLSLRAPLPTLIRLHHRLFGSIERRLLTGSHPRLFIFNIYKFGYYASLGDV